MARKTVSKTMTDTDATKKANDTFDAMVKDTDNKFDEKGRDAFVNAYVYMNVTRIKAGLESFDHWVVVGKAGWSFYDVKTNGTSNNPNWREQINKMFNGCLTKDEINYSLRVAGHIQKATTTIIDTDKMRTWLVGLAFDAETKDNPIASRSYASCRRMVEAYAKHVKDSAVPIQVENEEGENEEGDDEPKVEAKPKDVINAIKEAIKQDALCTEQKSYNEGDRAKLVKLIGELNQSLLAGQFEEKQEAKQEKPEVKKEA